MYADDMDEAGPSSLVSLDVFGGRPTLTLSTLEVTSARAVS